MTWQTDLITALREAGRRLAESQNIRHRDALLGQLVVSAVDLIPAADAAGLSHTTGPDMHTSHATTPVVQELDQLQDRLAEGPCVSAANDPPPDGVFIAHDLSGDDAARWPRFAPSVVDAGFRSILSASLISEPRGRHHSALNLYSRTAHAYDDDAITTAGLFAGPAGALLCGADTAAHMAVALESRDLIGRAKGILIERFAITDAGAFQMLVESSQNTNMKLVDVATWLTSQSEAKAVKP